jgi:NAD(P)-dependent dehydrogenase (short-subunit alcohol dehydrogenase family)
MVQLDLSGQVAFITGGASGIGRAMAEAMGKAGAKVRIASRDRTAIEHAVRELKSGGIDAKGIGLDVVERNQIEAVVAKIIEDDGKIDILFNGAGVMIKHPVLEMPESVWDQVVNVNLKGTFLCTQAFARGMIARGYGRIINVSSGHVNGNATNSAYSASKGGVESFTKTFALELQQMNIDVTVNVIEPGGTDTPMWRRGKTLDYIKNALESGRIRPPDHMAPVVLYLASPASKAVNGQLIERNAAV